MAALPLCKPDCEWAAGEAAAAQWACPTNSTDLFRAHGLQWVSDEIFDGADEPLRVGLFDMRVEGGLVDPLGVNEEYTRIARRFIEMDANATRLGASGLQNQLKFVTQL